ncbi:MAG: hypothetical protein J6S10_02490, partial [Clostridia bacterium]|nr:hypothetical protein [Clostridia bacterium]
MKKTAITNLICSMIVTVVIIIGILLIMMVSNSAGIGKTKLVISSASATAIYSGEALSDPAWFLSEGALKEGHTLEVNVTGSQINVGSSENYISAIVRDADGADVSREYNIEYKVGILSVTARDIILIAESDMKLYDGTPLSCPDYTIESAMSLIATDKIEVTVQGSITEIGEEKNRIVDVKIKNKDGVNVTKNYNIQTVDGKLIVYDVGTLVFESDSDVKEYDGTDLVNTNWDLVSGSLRAGHTVNASFSCSQTDVGSSENTFTIQILDENGEDVTDTYEYICNPGTLTVYHKVVEVISGSGYKIYDGTPLTNSSFEVYPECEDFKFEPVIVGSQTELGTSQNTIESCVVYDSQNIEVTSNFKITCTAGTLTVGTQT